MLIDIPSAAGRAGHRRVARRAGGGQRCRERDEHDVGRHNDRGHDRLRARRPRSRQPHEHEPDDAEPIPEDRSEGRRQVEERRPGRRERQDRDDLEHAPRPRCGSRHGPAGGGARRLSRDDLLWRPEALENIPNRHLVGGPGLRERRVDVLANLGRQVGAAPGGQAGRRGFEPGQVLANQSVSVHHATSTASTASRNRVHSAAKVSSARSPSVVSR